MSRPRVWLIIVLWLAVVGVYWFFMVPLATTTSVAHGGDRLLLRRQPQPEIVLSRTKRIEGQGLRPAGPLEFWNPSEGRITRTLLSSADQIVLNNNFVSDILDDYVLTRQNGLLTLVNLETGERVGPFQDVGHVRGYQIHPERKELFVTGDTAVHCFRFGQYQPRWVLQDAMLSELVAGDLQAVTLIKAWRSNSKVSGWSEIGSALLHLDTGQLDRRFDSLGKGRIMALSKDGRLALIKRPNVFDVCDVTAARILWSLPVPTNGTARFSPDGRELVSWSSADLVPVDIQRRSVADGAEIKGEPSAELLAMWPFSGSRYIVRGLYEASDSKLQKWLSAYNSFCSSVPLRGLQIILPRSARLVEAGAGRTIGGLPTPAEFASTGGDQGLVAVTPTHIHYYALPPRQNYEWLAAWGLGPPIAFAALRRCLRSVHRAIQGRRAVAAIKAG